MMPFRSPYPRELSTTHQSRVRIHLPVVLVGLSALLFLGGAGVLFWLELGAHTLTGFLEINFVVALVQLICWRLLLSRTRIGRVLAFAGIATFWILTFPMFIVNPHDASLTRFFWFAGDLWAASFVMTMVASLVPPGVTPLVPRQESASLPSSTVVVSPSGIEP